MKNIQCRDRVRFTEIRIPVSEIKEALKNSVSDLTDFTSMVEAFVGAYDEGDKRLYYPGIEDYLWAFRCAQKASDEASLIAFVGSGAAVKREHPFLRTEDCRPDGCLETLGEEELCVAFAVADGIGLNLVVAYSCYE